ncbi:MAG: LytR C-terminal domain-containing protein, partial [Nocardioidaceae bacterium]
MMSPLRWRRSDERGIALSSPVALLSLAAVVLAGVAFVTTGGTPEPQEEATKAVTATPLPEPTATATKKVIDKKKPAKKPVVRRGEVYVEVYNNSGISGLAGAVASRIAGAGWQVVGSDNWYGTIPESTVYYPERLQQAAKLLAKDLGIQRLKPAISPMRFDRLTV